jgi:hypothetical protein
MALREKNSASTASTAVVKNSELPSIFVDRTIDGVDIDAALEGDQTHLLGAEAKCQGDCR